MCRVDKYIEKVEQLAEKQDKQKHLWFFNGTVSVRLVPSCRSDAEVCLSRISSYDRGKGYATRVLATLTDLADKMDITMRLYPRPFWLSSKPEVGMLDKERLVSWYKRYGFCWKKFKVWDTHKKQYVFENDFMIRQPGGG